MHSTPTTNLRKRHRKPPPPPPAFVGDDALLTVREVAALRRCGVSTVWRDTKAGTIVAPIYVGPKMPRWRLRDLKAGIGGAT